MTKQQKEWIALALLLALGGAIMAGIASLGGGHDQAFSAFVIGGIGAYIAFRHWKLDHDKLKLELFDRRLAAYQRLKDAVTPIAASGKVTHEDTDRFARAMYDMRFLFDKRRRPVSMKSTARCSPSMR